MNKPLYRVAHITKPNSIGAFYDREHLALYVANGEIDAYGVLRTSDGLWCLPSLQSATALWENNTDRGNCCWLFQNPPHLPLVLCLVDLDTHDTNPFYFHSFLNTANNPIPEPRGVNPPHVVRWEELQASQVTEWLKEIGYGR